MPAYATLDDLIDRFEERELIELTDDAGAGSIDQVRVDRACLAATAVIDGYLTRLYKLPLARVPGNIVDIACDIARFKLWRQTAPDNVQKANDAAIKALEQVARGLIKIDAGAAEQPAREGAIVTTLDQGLGDGDRIFGRDSMKGF